jgi:hypothetical protein
MVAETSAWGRALAAIGIATNKSIASAEEVRSARERSGGFQSAGSKPAGTGATPKGNGAQSASQDVSKGGDW